MQFHIKSFACKNNKLPIVFHLEAVYITYDCINYFMKFNYENYDIL